MGDSKLNLWYNEFRMFDVLKKFPRYCLKEYVFQIVAFVKKSQLLENKIVQLSRKVNTIATKLIGENSPPNLIGAFKSFELQFSQVVASNVKDILELLDEDFQEVIRRTLNGVVSTGSSCILSRTHRLNKFFENYTFKLRRSLSLAEYFIQGDIIVQNKDNQVKKGLAVIDVDSAKSRISAA